MTLLLRPLLRKGEGQTGFLFRLAQTNEIDLVTLKNLNIQFDLQLLNGLGYLPELFLDSDIGKYAKLLEDTLIENPRAWNREVPRYCPICLKHDAYWRYEWEILYFDACPEHQLWLIDKCSECQQLLSWKRSDLLRCTCGANLCNQQSACCPDAIVKLCRTLQIINVGNETPLHITTHLKLSQQQRLLRFLGAYGDPSAGLRANALTGCYQLASSWQVTSLAAEILDQWPKSFHIILDVMQNLKNEMSAGKLFGRFGNFYTQLYREFSEPEFDFMRIEFELYIAENWRGSFSRRNRRLFEKLHQKMAWIPANVARKALGISNRRLRNLVKEGLINGEECYGNSGRKLLVVSRLDIEASRLETELDLTAVANLLNLKKSRLVSLLPMLIPEGRKTGGAGCPWAIPRKTIDDLLSVNQRVSEKTAPLAEEVSLAHMLRYWIWSDESIAQLLLATLDEIIAPVGKLNNQTGITGWIFCKSQLYNWHESTHQKLYHTFSIPEVAKRLSIKQEVAYFFVRNGILNSEVVKKGRFIESRIKPEELEAFSIKYGFGRDLAATVGTSSHALATKLSRLGIHPICGPKIDGCRQLLFEKNSELDKALNMLIDHKKKFNGRFSRVSKLKTFLC